MAYYYNSFLVSAVFKVHSKDKLQFSSAHFERNTYQCCLVFLATRKFQISELPFKLWWKVIISNSFLSSMNLSGNTISIN